MPTFKLNTLEMTQLENIKLRGQLLAAHKEIMSLNEKALEQERTIVRNAMIKARDIHPDLDVLIDDVKGLIHTQAKAASQ